MLHVGQVLAGRFSVHGLLRRGGMGVIYRGLDLSSGASVAIKILGGLGSHMQERFVREARVLAELEHPAVVRHIAHGTADDGTMYLVTEWLEGEELSERLARAPLQLEEATALVRRVCEALELVHARGVVHRDIKPANLFLARADPAGVKLLDFGVALHGEPQGALTESGTLLGTVGYMSPEQAKGSDDVDQRADIFALGCVLYECLTGRAPFASAHVIGVLAKVLHDEPVRPSEISAGLDPRFDTLVARMLAKNRGDRLPDTRAVLADLGSITTHPPSSFPRRRTLSSVSGTEQRIVSVILGKLGGGASRSASAAPVLAALDRVAARFGAQIASLKGGVLSLVSSGRGEANDRASRAVLCALDVQRCLTNVPLAVATGLAETSGGVPIGVAIDRAASLLERIDRDGVCLDEVTLGLIGLRFEVERAGPLIRLLAARTEFDAPRRLMGRFTPHLGRERELRTLDGVLDECASESVSRMVLVTGSPGIGKSRLAQAESKNGFEDADGCPDELPKAVQRFTGVIAGDRVRDRQGHEPLGLAERARSGHQGPARLPQLARRDRGAHRRHGRSQLQRRPLRAPRGVGAQISARAGHRGRPHRGQGGRTSRSYPTRNPAAARRTAASSSTSCSERHAAVALLSGVALAVRPRRRGTRTWCCRPHRSAATRSAGYPPLRQPWFMAPCTGR
ncbi:MAG: hypothetical protein RL685_1791 [Pseudomonadota bacterium]